MDNETADRGISYGLKMTIVALIFVAMAALAVGIAIGMNIGNRPPDAAGETTTRAPDVCDQLDDDCGGSDPRDDTLKFAPDYSGSMDLELDRIERAIEDYARMRMGRPPSAPSPTPIVPPLPENRNRVWEL